MEKENFVKQCIHLGILPGVDLLSDDIQLPTVIPETLSVATRDALQLIDKTVDWFQLDRLRSRYEHGLHQGYQEYLQLFSEEKLLTQSVQAVTQAPISLVSVYAKEGTKRTVNDFVHLFRHRYTALERILRLRPELQHTISINRALKKQSREPIAIIGMVSSKSDTKNGNLMIDVEDPTGTIRVLVNKNRPDLLAAARDLVFDEVIGLSGVCGSRIIFANNIFWPDVPYNHELRKSSHDIYAVFLSDIHVGSEYFLESEFKRFLRWINLKSGTPEQRDIAAKVQYLFIAGDIVDGVGIYPGQDKELVIKNIYEQYELFAQLIKQVPEHINIIICPGNHDALRLGEPQPVLDADFAAPLYQLKNVTIVSNPSLVNIETQTDFPGFDILLYHGYSFDYYVANVDSIRSNGGYHSADLIMKFLLKRRHLAPAQGSTLRIPDAEADPLVISRIPDFFVTGHIHYSLVAHYRNITLISGSCWQRTTAFQEKMGHKPEPARVPVVNLRTRTIKILKFI